MPVPAELDTDSVVPAELVNASCVPSGDQVAVPLLSAMCVMPPSNRFSTQRTSAAVATNATRPPSGAQAYEETAKSGGTRKPEFCPGVTCRSELSKSDLAMKLMTPLRENRASAGAV